MPISTKITIAICIQIHVGDMRGKAYPALRERAIH
jgi:hypothetical protein